MIINPNIAVGSHSVFIHFVADVMLEPVTDSDLLLLPVKTEYKVKFIIRCFCICKASVNIYRSAALKK